MLVTVHMTEMNYGKIVQRDSGGIQDDFREFSRNLQNDFKLF